MSKRDDLYDRLLENIASDIDLQTKKIQKSVSEFLTLNQNRWATETHRQYRVRLERFVGYCVEDLEVDHLDELDRSDIADFRLYLTEQGYQPRTKEDNLKILRQFLEFAANRLWVKPYLPDAVEVDQVPDTDEVREEMIEYETLRDACDHLRKYEYATNQHLVLLLLTEAGLRIGSMRALDVDDFRKQPYRLKLNHRPETGTRLKNGSDSEREIQIKKETAAVIEDYLENNRPSVTDESGRKPLVASENGRLSDSVYRKYVYKWTQPCQLGQECPVGRDPEECEATQRLDQAAGCPESKSPHSARKGYITYLDEESINLRDIAERCDVSPGVIKKHYSHVDETQEAENRFDRIQDRLDSD